MAKFPVRVGKRAEVSESSEETPTNVPTAPTPVEPEMPKAKPEPEAEHEEGGEES